jgi:hypothetical protein
MMNSSLAIDWANTEGQSDIVRLLFDAGYEKQEGTGPLES